MLTEQRDRPADGAMRAATPSHGLQLELRGCPRDHTPAALAGPALSTIEDWGSLALSPCPVLWLLDKGRAANTLVKGLPLSFSIAALQVSRRAPSKATAMSASLNCNDKHKHCLWSRASACTRGQLNSPTPGAI